MDLANRLLKMMLSLMIELFSDLPIIFQNQEETIAALKSGEIHEGPFIQKKKNSFLTEK